MTAFTTGFTASSRARIALTASRLDTERVRIASARARALHCQISAISPSFFWCGELPGSDVLPAVDVDLGAVDVGGLRRAEQIDDRGNLLGLAEPAHRDLPLHDLIGARR